MKTFQCFKSKLSTYVAALAVVAFSAHFIQAAIQVVCVPWQGNENLFHTTWNGKQIRVKGTVRPSSTSNVSVSYTWNFGDGTPTVSGTVSANSSYLFPVEALHTYNGAVGQMFIATLSATVTIAGETTTETDEYRVIIADNTPEAGKTTSQAEINVGIDEGLWYLYKTQTRTMSGAAKIGYWSMSYNVASTGSGVQAFENNSHKPDGDTLKDPYVDCVQRGLNYITQQMSFVALTGSNASFDADGNGIGLSCYAVQSQEMYEIGMAMMALVSSETPGKIAETGPATYVLGRTYRALAQDLADFIGYAQCISGSYIGGWRYQRSYRTSSSDNSVSQWPILGLEPAEANWGIIVPAIVRSNLDIWLTASRYAANGGYTYDRSYTGYSMIARTAGTGITGLLFCNNPASDSRVTSAISYLSSNWGATGNYGNIGNLYAMYGVKKAFSEEFLNQQFVGTHDWYDEYSRYIINNQNNYGNGSTNIVIWGNYPLLSTAWSVLILTPGLHDVPPTAVAKVNGLNQTQVDINQVVNFDASQSTNGDYTIVKYEWDFDGDGVWDFESPDPTAQHTYTSYSTNVVILRVTDDRDIITGGAKPAMIDLASCKVFVTPPPHPPIADAGGPYIGAVGVPVTLDGSGSWEPNENIGESIVQWLWDLDNDGEFDDASGETVQHTWDAPATYPIGLMVISDAAPTESAPSRTLVTIGNSAPVADAGGPYQTRVDEGVTLDGTGSTDPNPGDAIVSYEWDFDLDGQFDDATGANPVFISAAEGNFVVRLRVTDTFGANDVADALVTVGNLAPIAIIANPIVGIPNVPVTLDGSGSYDPDAGDAIVAYEWELNSSGQFNDASGSTVTATFANPGNYEIGLRVRDDHGKTGTAFELVTIVSLPAPIDNLAARAKLNKVQLTWSPVAGASSYNVYRKTGAGSYELLAAGVVTDYCTYLDQGLTYNVTYCYLVTSVKDGFESEESNEACATPVGRTR